MKTIDLVAEELEAFRSFVEPSGFNFPLRGLYGIRGRNADTGGSSGAGKSSINLGIAYALGYCPFPATELQSWLTDKPMSVTLKLTTPDTGLVVTRGGSGLRLGVRAGDESSVLKGKQAEAELTRRLGLSPAMLSALTYRAQRSDGTFLSKTNTEIQEFLTTVLALEPYEQAILLSAKNIKTLEDTVQQLLGKSEVLANQSKEAFRQLQEAQAAYQAPNTATLELDIEAARVEVGKWLVICEGIAKRMDDQQGLLRAAIDAQVQEIRKELSLLKPRQVTAHRDAGAGSGYERELTRIKEEYQELDRNMGNGTTCPACKRPMGADHMAQYVCELDQKRARLAIREKSALDGIQSAKAAALQAGMLDADIRSMETRIQFQEQEVGKAFTSALEGLRAASQEATRQSAAARDQVSRLQSQLSDIKAKDLNAKSGIKFLEQLGVRADEAVLEQQLAMNLAGTSLGTEQDFSAMVGREGFLGAIFDEVLAEIAQETNAILARVPNVAHVTLAFRSESVTGKGTVKRAITPVVTVGGHEANLKSGCSGGMLGAVYLAADLAVIDVVSRRLGVAPGWLVLDESFEGLGAVEKEGYLEVLQGYAEKKLVLVVDHSTETKEYLSDSISLVYQGGATRIEQQEV